MSKDDKFVVPVSFATEEAAKLFVQAISEGKLDGYDIESATYTPIVQKPDKGARSAEAWAALEETKKRFPPGGSSSVSGTDPYGIRRRTRS